MKPQTEENLFQYLKRMIDSGVEPVVNEKEIWKRYGESVAVLVLDSSGFSRVSESHGIVHFLSKLMQVREQIKPVFESHGCQQLHFEADNIFAAFGGVDDAANCAMAIHQSIYEAGIMLTESERFSVCIGIGYGEMLYSETLEGYFSEEMNFASKLGEDTANAHETLLTENAYQSMTGSLKNNFTPQTIQLSGLDIPYYKDISEY